MRTPGAALAMLLAALAACGGDGDGGNGPGDEGTAQVRVIHMTPEAAALDVTVDDDVVVADGIVYQEVGAYTEVPAGDIELAVANDAGGAELVTITPTLERDAQYTVVVTGFLDEVVALVYTDDNRAASLSGAGKMRLIHAAPSGPAVDLYLQPVDEGEPTIRILGNVSFGAAAPYSEEIVSDFTWFLNAAGTFNLVFDFGLYDFDPMIVHTLVLGDSPGGGPPFVGFFVRDPVREAE